MERVGGIYSIYYIGSSYRSKRSEEKSFKRRGEQKKRIRSRGKRVKRKEVTRRDRESLRVKGI